MAGIPVWKMSGAGNDFVVLGPDAIDALGDGLTDWVRRVDEDGTCDTNQRNHENRNARMVQDFDQSWRWEGGCGSLQGAQMHEIFRHFYDAETESDWDKARLEHGDEARAEHLPRSDAQRRADAVYAIYLRAASTPPGGKPPGKTIPASARFA